MACHLLWSLVFPVSTMPGVTCLSNSSGYRNADCFGRFLDAAEVAHSRIFVLCVVASACRASSIQREAEKAAAVFSISSGLLAPLGIRLAT
jgi:hypothetical protein